MFNGTHVAFSSRLLSEERPTDTSYQNLKKISSLDVVKPFFGVAKCDNGSPLLKASNTDGLTQYATGLFGSSVNFRVHALNLFSPESSLNALLNALDFLPIG